MYSKTDTSLHPNEEVLEAQARVCTGPHQSRPLGIKPSDPKPNKILKEILKTATGRISQEQKVSEAQMGAFFAAMTIRKRFPDRTNWSEAEIEAFEQYQNELEHFLPPDILFLMNPDLGYSAANHQERVVVTALQQILKGGHLSWKETRIMGEAILDGDVKESLKAAVLIGQRMNRETYDEVRGYLDSVFSPDKILEVQTEALTHFGQPYDGSTRFFRPTLFVAAVRAAQGRASVLHGVDEMPPKKGITEEKLLGFLGARTDLSLEKAARLIEDHKIGFSFVSLRSYSPSAYAIRNLRVHIKKRPPWAATEKAQQLFFCPGTNSMVIGFYHAGYEASFLRLIQDRGFCAGLVVKGEEGSSHFSLCLRKPTAKGRKSVNYVKGFRRSGDHIEDFALDVNPKTFGFNYDRSPRLQSVSVCSFVQAGMAALSGQRGQVYDQILLNSSMTDYLLGFFPNFDDAFAHSKDAIDSGRALEHLKAYVDRTKRI